MMCSLKKRAISVLLVLVFLLLPLATSCSDDSKAVMELGKYKITENMYYWLLCMNKSQYYATLSSYQSGGYIDNTVDINTPEFWAEVSESTGKSFADIVTENAVNTAKYYLVGADLFDKYGLKLTDTLQDDIDAEITNTETAVESNGYDFDEYLSQFGIDKKCYREMRVYEKKISMLIDHLFGPGGEKEITDAMTQKIYNENKDTFNYANVNHIMIYSVGIDSNGKATQLTEEEYLAKKAKVQELYDKINSGEATFEELLSESDDDYSPGGYLISSSTTDVLTEEFITAALAMKVGEIRMVESEGIAFHIIKRYELTAENLTAVNDEVKSQLEAVAQKKMFEEGFADIAVNDEVAAQYDAVYAPVMQ